MSRNAAGRGRALLEGLGLFVGRIDMCFGGHPNDEEAAVQQGLTYWIDGEGIQATWAALLEAMKYAGLAQQHIQSLKADLGVTEGILSMCSCVCSGCVMCMWCVVLFVVSVCYLVCVSLLCLCRSCLCVVFHLCSLILLVWIAWFHIVVLVWLVLCLRVYQSEIARSTSHRYPWSKPMPCILILG